MVRERHFAFAHTRLVGYVEQASLLEKLDAWAAGSAEIEAKYSEEGQQALESIECGLRRVASSPHSGSRASSGLNESSVAKLGHTVCIVGESGVGKTALMAAAGVKLAESDPSAIGILHFAGVDSESGHLKHIIWRIVTELTEVHMTSSVE